MLWLPPLALNPQNNENTHTHVKARGEVLGELKLRED